MINMNLQVVIFHTFFDNTDFFFVAFQIQSFSLNHPLTSYVEFIEPCPCNQLDQLEVTAI